MKKYVKQTIRTRSGVRIAEVLKRYYKHKNTPPDVYEMAKEVFEGDVNKQGEVT